MAVLSYLWDFGDGTISRLSNPTHTYRLPGRYKVVLVVFDEDCGNLTYEFIIRTYDWGTDIGDLNVSKTDTCLRFAIPQQIGQGVGWAEYNNNDADGNPTGDFPMPEAVVGTCQIIDELKIQHQLVIDSNSFRIFELGKDDWWQDGANEDYAGSEFESEILLREHVPPIGASAKLKHNETHAIFKPWQKNRRNTGDYNDTGFRDAFSSDIFIRQDAQPTDLAVAKMVPDRGQVVHDRHVESEYLQPGIRARGAPWRLPRVQVWYSQLDTASAPDQKLMSEMSWSLQFSEKLLWLARQQLDVGVLPSDYATATDFGGTFTSQITGPDGKSLSAFAMSAGDSFTKTLDTFSGDTSFVAWVRSPADGLVLFSLATGGLTITLRQNGVGWEVIWQDDDNVIAIDLSVDFSSWSMLVIAKEGDVLRVFENGRLANTAAIAVTTTIYGGATVLAAGQSVVYDLVIVPRNIDVRAAEWAYDDVIQNHADTVGAHY